MRVFGPVLLVACLTMATFLGAQATPAPSGQRPAALSMTEQVLDDARRALGGGRLSAIKAFIVTGRTRRVSGNNRVPVRFEIDVELPDKYVRKDELPAHEAAPSSSGFNGDHLIQIPPPAAMTLEQQQAAALRARLMTVKQDFARLMLGMYAKSFSGYPLTFSYVGQEETPQGKADVLEAQGAGDFTARFFLNSDTHVPIMVSWTVPVTPANIVMVQPTQARPANLPPGAVVVRAPAAPPAGASKEDQDKYVKDVAALRQKAIAEAKPIEHRLHYSDWRNNGSVQFPFKLQHAIGPDIIEETTFDGFKLDAKIDPKRFDFIK